MDIKREIYLPKEYNISPKEFIKKFYKHNDIVCYVEYFIEDTPYAKLFICKLEVENDNFYKDNEPIEVKTVHNFINEYIIARPMIMVDEFITPAILDIIISNKELAIDILTKLHKEKYGEKWKEIYSLISGKN